MELLFVKGSGLASSVQVLYWSYFFQPVGQLTFFNAQKAACILKYVTIKSAFHCYRVPGCFQINSIFAP